MTLPDDVNGNSTVNLADAFHVFNRQDDVAYDVENDLNGNFVVNLTDVFLVVGNLDSELPSAVPDCAASTASAYSGVVFVNQASGIVVFDGLHATKRRGVDGLVTVVSDKRSYERLPEARLIDEIDKILLPKRFYKGTLCFTQEDDETLLGLAGLMRELL